jgi:hypothetical protein
MSGWFSWWDTTSKPAREDPEEWRIGTPGSLRENPSLREPLDNIPEESSGAESSTSESAMESDTRRTAREILAYMQHKQEEKREKTRRTLREIREHVAENSPENRQDNLLRSTSSEDYSRRDAYKVEGGSSEDTEDYTDDSETVDYSADSLAQKDEEIDYEVVEQYAHAFNEFIAANPEFVMISPDVVHSLRVCKLQKLLERGRILEEELKDQYENISRHKLKMEIHYQKELRDASRKKAARTTSLTSKLAATQKATSEMEAQLLWRLVSTHEFNAKKQHTLREHHKNFKEGKDRGSLLAVLPKAKECQSIRDAMLAPPSFREEPLSEEQENDLMQFQIDNAILQSEVAMLKKMLARVKAAAKKNAWVESMLVRMDPKVLMKLKAKVEKTKGVSL